MGLLGQLEGTVAALDLLEHHRVLGVGAGGLGGLGQSPLPLLDPIGHVPQATLVDPGQGQHVLLDPRAGDEVVGLHAQLAPGAAAVEAGPLEHVEPVAGHELVGDVGGRLGVDDPVAGAGRPEDRVARTGVGLDLEVHPRPAPAERAEQLGDQSLAFEAPHPGDHRHAVVQVEAEGVVAGFNHESFEVHPRGIGPEKPKT